MDSPGPLSVAIFLHRCVDDVSGGKELEASMEVSSLTLERAGCLHL